MNILTALLSEGAKIFKRDLDSSIPSNYSLLFDGFPTASGKRAGKKASLGLSAVYHAVDLISQDFASMPLVIYRPLGDNKEIVTDHNVHRLLNFEPNYYQTPIDFNRCMAVYRLIYGNAYALIDRYEASGQIRNLLPVHPDYVHEIVNVDGELFYKIKGIEDPVSSYNIIHVKDLSIEHDSYKGTSRIDACREVMGRGIALDEFTSAFFGNGANPGLVFESEMGALDDEEKRKSFENSIQRKFSGSEKAFKALFLPAGLKLSASPSRFNQQQTQFIETKIHFIEEVAQIFNLPLNKMRIKEDGKSYGSQEQSNIEYVTDCLRPFSKAFEQEYARKLFGSMERGQLFVKVQLESRLRGDMAAQTEHVVKMIQNGVYSVNQALSFLGQNGIGPEGDERYIQSNLMYLGQTGITDKPQEKPKE